MEQVEKRTNLTPWLLLWLGLNVADWVLTVLVLRAGGAETNELFNRLGEPSFAVFKFVVPILLVPLLAYFKKLSWIRVFSLGMIVVVYHNLTWML